MGRGHGFENQYYGYGNDGMWMESSQGHKQQSYALHEDHTHHRKPFPGMPMMPNMHNMHMPHHSSSSSSSPSAAFRVGVMSPRHHHPGQCFQFENEWQGHGYPAGAGPRRFGFGPTNNFPEEVTEYDRSYSEERYGGGGAMMEHSDEMRFHRNNYGGGNYGGGNYGGGFGFNPYDNNFASKPQYGYQHPVEWRARGV